MTDAPKYQTALSPTDEQQFQSWVKSNNVPWRDEPTADYDMRGFWKGLESGDPRAKQAQSQFDGRLHFPDTWKTPYHRTLSNESIYAPPDAPRWQGDRLIDKNGRVVADETPKTSAPQWDSTDNHVAPASGATWQSTDDHLVIDDPNNVRVGTSNGIPVYKSPDANKGGFWDAFWEGTGGKAAMDLMAGASRTKEGAEKTKETAKALIQGLAAEPGRVWDELSATGQAMLKGDLPSAAYHAAGSVPMVGAPAQQVGQDFSNGDYARGFGHAFGLLLPFMTAALPKDVNIGLKSQLNPVMQKAVDFAERKNIPVPMSVKTGGRFARGMESLVENDIGGSRYVGQARQATTDAIQRTGQDLAAQAYPQSVTPHQAGSDAIATYKQGIVNLDQAADAHYSNAWKAEQDPFNIQSVPAQDAKGKPIMDPATGQQATMDMPLPVDMSDVKTKLRPILENFEYTTPNAKANASIGYKALENIINGPDFKPVSQAERDLSMLKEASRVEMPQLRDTSQGIAAASVKALDEQIRQTMANAKVQGYNPAGGGQNPALTALLEGRKATAQKWQLADTLKSLGPIDTLEPVQVFQQLTWGRDSGIERLKQIQQQAPQSLPKIGRAYVEGLLDTATRAGAFDKTQQILNQWDQLGPQTKRMMFQHPGLIADLDNFFVLARKAAENPNPSGTALVNQIAAHAATLSPAGFMLVSSPLSSTMAAAVGTQVVHAISNAVIARLLFSPAGSRALIKGLTVPLRTPAGAAAAAQILKLAGKDAKPVDPKKLSQQ